YGFKGADTYYVSDSNALIFDPEISGGGDDTLITSVSFTLRPGDSIEVIRASDFNAVLGLTLIGSQYTDQIFGDAGNNFLSGGGGHPSMRGGAGDDVYLVAG